MKYFLTGVVISLVTLPTIVFAQGNLNDALGNLNNVGKRAGTSNAPIESVVGNLINGALSMVGIIFLILMVYAGYLWMTARGEEEQIKKSQNIIRSSVIGMVVVVSAYAITFFVTSRLEKNSGSGGGQVGCCRSIPPGSTNPTATVMDDAACTNLCSPGRPDRNNSCTHSIVARAALCN